MIHYTEMSFNGALQRLTDKKSKVSAHYLIKENGEIFQLVDNSNVAWHAGKSAWNGCESLNQTSIGIELDNLGNCEFPHAQMQACIELSQELIKKYDIPTKNFIAHSDVAPERKIDPGIFFDWQLCAENGLGIWHNIVQTENAKTLLSSGDKGGKVKQLQKDLNKLGYTLDITSIFDQQTNFVIRAFQSKFCPEIIRKKGISYYNDNNSQYHWCAFSDEVLQRLLTLIR